jgi:hypothetical protein
MIFIPELYVSTPELLVALQRVGNNFKTQLTPNKNCFNLVLAVGIFKPCLSAVYLFQQSTEIRLRAQSELIEAMTLTTFSQETAGQSTRLP